MQNILELFQDTQKSHVFQTQQKKRKIKSSIALQHSFKMSARHECALARWLQGQTPSERIQKRAQTPSIINAEHQGTIPMFQKITCLPDSSKKRNQKSSLP